jgi:hypothetical protein
MNRKTTEIVCERLQFGPRSANSPSASQSGSGQQTPRQNNQTDTLKAKDVAVEEIPSIDIEDMKPEDLPF